MALIDEIYEAVTDEPAFARLPGLLANAVGARSGILFEYDAGFAPHTWVRHRIPDEINERFVRLNMAPHDIWAQIGNRVENRNRAVVCEDVYGLENFQRSTFYNEMYRAAGDDTARCMVMISACSEGFHGVGLHRKLGDRPYSAADTAALQATMPHLRRLGEVRARLRKATQRGNLLRNMLDLVPLAVLVAGPDGRLRHANRSGEELLRSGNGLRLIGGKIASLDTAISHRLAEAIRSAAQGNAGRGDAMLVRKEGRPSSTLIVTPYSGNPGGALLLVDEHRQSEISVAALLSRLYGATRAEGDLADCLVKGLSPEEAAEVRGVRISTVRTQVGMLIAKTDSHNLRNLMRLLGRLSALAG